MIVIGTCGLVGSFSRGHTTRMNARTPKSISLQWRLTHTAEESVERVAVLLFVWMHRKCIFHQVSRAAAESPLTISHLKTAQTQISIGFGDVDLYSRKGSSTAFQGHCVFGLCYRQVHNLAGMGSSCSRRKVMCKSLMLRAYDFPHITTLCFLTWPVSPIPMHVLSDGA